MAIRHGYVAILVLGAQQSPVDSGHSFLLDLMCQAVFDFDIGARPKVERDQFGGTFAKALCQIFAADDEIPALLVLPPNDDVGVGMARVEMIDRDPVELDRKSTRLNYRH